MIITGSVDAGALGGPVTAAGGGFGCPATDVRCLVVGGRRELRDDDVACSLTATPKQYSSTTCTKLYTTYTYEDLRANHREEAQFNPFNF